MNTLIIGGGGRENAILHELKKNNQNHQFFCDSPNALMSQDCQSIGPVNKENISKKLNENAIDFVIIGPEQPLVDGLADAIRNDGVLVFGPGEKAAQLEASKILSKNFMNDFAIPTAKAQVVESVDDVVAVYRDFTPPYVLKADGLCAGKGVFICKDAEELFLASNKVFNEKIFGDQKALLEQFEAGKEISYFFLTNGEAGLALPLFRDHKRLHAEDQGPNTGGMGVVGPIDDDALMQELEEKIMKPTLAGFQKSNFEYKGVVFVGVMLTSSGPRVLEYNVRFGDPETQCIFPSLDPSKGDNWLTALTKIAKGKLPTLAWKNEKVACVVAAAPGYPDSPKKNISIQGQPFINNSDSYVIHAGTHLDGETVVSSGGRVLSFIGIGSTFESALDKAYALTKECHFEDMHCRHDIGHSLRKSL